MLKLNNENKSEILQRANRVMFTQMQAKEIIKRFGERAVAVLIKEFKQLNDGDIPVKPVFFPIHLKELTEEEKRQSLNEITLIKEKRDCKIKGRACD